MITLEDINKACLEALPARWKQYLGGKGETMSETKSTKPSAGVMRAANRIMEKRYDPIFHTKTLAEIIDRETGVGELLEAAKKAEKWFAFYYKFKDDNDPDPKHVTWDQLKQAIAKAEGLLRGL